jgi:hypothetical protein
MGNKANGSGGCGGASQPDSSDDKAPSRPGGVRSTPNPSASEPFARVASQFEKTGLVSPDKLERMIRIAVDGLLAQEFKELSFTQRRRLAAWMRNDPLVRERLVTAFEKILS